MRTVLIVRKWRRDPIIIAYASVFFYIFIVITFIRSQDSVKIETAFKNVDSTRNGQEICALPIYDIWHKDVKPLLTGFNPMEGCDKTFRKWTELENREWRIVKEGANCSARCFEGVGASKEIKFQGWMKPGKTDCEFIEAVCWKNNKEVYGYTHSQIIPRTAKPPKTKFPSPPNVLVFTIDSLNTGMAKRSLPKFLSHFQKTFEAIEFPFVNKVGEHSQPNGFPLWFGKRIEKGRTVSWEELKPDWNETEFCERYLDEQSHIFKDFKEHGYATALLEDWMHTLLDSWPFCKGFKERPADHSFRPIPSVYEGYGLNITRYHLKGYLCRETHHPAMEYLEQLMNAYRDRPLFTWTWLNNIAHNHIDGPARIDDYLVDFLKRNQKILENSFVFFISDHGLRFGYGDYFRTEIGSFERHNPYLAISIPKGLRDKGNGILEVLKVNSRKLQTHFDTRATLLDILKYQPTSNFSSREFWKIPEEKGTSLVRRQLEEPRTCGTLPIPQQYCICQVDKWEIKDKILKKHLGQKLVDHVHKLLVKSKVIDLCEHYNMEEVTSLIEYGYSKSWNTYKISVKTNFKAHFETLMVYNENDGSTSFEKVVRLDTYGKTADCTESIKFEALCHCKNNNTTGSG